MYITACPYIYIIALVLRMLSKEKYND